MSKAGIRHVLNPQPQSEVFGHSPIETDVAGEFEIIAEIPGREALEAEYGWGDAGFNRDWKTAPAQLAKETDGANEGAGIAIVNPASGGIHGRTQEPF